MHENKPEGANIHFRFVCQKANAHDVVNFVELTERYDAECSISRLDDWGTFENFAEEGFGKPSRSEIISRVLGYKPN